MYIFWYAFSLVVHKNIDKLYIIVFEKRVLEKVRILNLEKVMQSASYNFWASKFLISIILVRFRYSFLKNISGKCGWTSGVLILIVSNIFYAFENRCVVITYPFASVNNYHLLRFPDFPARAYKICFVLFFIGVDHATTVAETSVLTRIYYYYSFIPNTFHPRTSKIITHQRDDWNPSDTPTDIIKLYNIRMLQAI